MAQSDGGALKLATTLISRGDREISNTEAGVKLATTLVSNADPVASNYNHGAFSTGGVV
jgi:hypothetical protein